MTTYGDPTRCPDCGSTLPTDPTACPTCRLPLTGPLAHELHRTLVAADALIERLRAQPVVDQAPAPAREPAARVARSTTTGRGLSAASVPSILLGLGALCLLVAAVTFLAVAWSWLGIGGRTAILVGLTLATGGLGSWLARRGLRIAGESLTVVALGLLVLDVVGADNAGWLGELSTSGLTAVVGAVVAGAAGALALSQGPRLVTPQVMAPLGLSVALFGTLDTTAAADLVIAAAVLAHVTLAAAGRARGLRVLAGGGLLGAGAWWLALVGSGLTRALAHPSFGDLWLGLEGWPLLAAATVMAGGAVVLRRRPHLASPCAAASAALAALLLGMPAVDESATHVVVTAVLVLAVASAALVLVPRSWAVAPAAPLLLAAVPAATIGVSLLFQGAFAVLLVGPPASRDLTVRLAGTDPVAHPGVLVPVVTVLVAAAVAGMSATTGRRLAARSAFLPGGTALALAGIGTAALHAVPLALVALGLALLAAVLVAASLVGGRGDLRALAGALAGAVALTAALPSAWLTTIVLAVAVAATAAALVLGRFEGAGLLLPVAAAGLVWSICEVARVDPAHRAVPVLLLVGALGLARPRLSTEAGAALAALTAAAVSVPMASAPATSLALHLTLAGAMVSVSALVHPSRRALAWPGGLLLAAATWVRLADLDVSEPEAYTLPSAVVLVLVGLGHLWRHPGSSSRMALGPGLALATVPSLLVVLVEDPVSLRATLLGAGCFLLVMVGVRLHWSAPLGVGASVGGVLVLRELAPYAAETPQWVLMGLAGTALTLVGITWERRMRDLQQAAAYLARLR